MDSQQSHAQSPSRHDDRRRSTRLPIEVSVSLSWKDAKGVPTEVQARAVEGNAFGGYLEIANPPPLFTHASLHNHLSSETIPVRVVRVQFPKPDTQGGAGVEFLSPNDAFWGA